MSRTLSELMSGDVHSSEETNSFEDAQLKFLQQARR